MQEDLSVIRFPDYDKIKEEVKRYKAEVSILLLERDELQFITCRNIEMAYMLALGSVEYTVYELHCDILRQKRKIELIQARKNRSEKVIVSEIEEILDEEFTEYKRQLDEQIDKMNQALERSKGEVLTGDQTRELKKLYRSIVKGLHPDLNPDVTQAEQALFQNAVRAYECGDLDSLRIIARMITDLPETVEYSDELTILVKEKERLLQTIEGIKNQIERIKSEYPYTMKELVEDASLVEKKRSELEQNVEKLKEIRQHYINVLNELLR